MSTYIRPFLLSCLKLADVLIFILSMLLASWIDIRLKEIMSMELFFSMRIKLINSIGILSMILVWHLIFKRFKLYHSQRMNKILPEVVVGLKATAVATGIFACVGLVFGINVFTLRFLILFWITSSLLVILFRFFLRISLRQIRLLGRNLRFVLIVGTNLRAYEFAHMLEEKKELGYRIAGFVDNTIHLPNSSLHLLGNLDNFPQIIRDTVIDEVVIALPVRSFYEEIQRIVGKAEEHGLIIRYLSHLFETKIAQSRLEKIEQYTILTMSSGHHDGWTYVFKRAMDYTLSFILSIFLLPLIGILALIIKLTSEGPVFFKQDRVGRNKRIFKLYKFRTMVKNAEQLQKELESSNEMDGPVFKIKNDPRITALGRFLRRTSLDELPQIFNVLKGEISLVGPRPLPIRDYSGFDQDWQLRRFSVLPGITCTWQISGRNTISFEKWMQLDMEYIDNWSLRGDIVILLKTIPAVVFKKGAA